jgi:hypothetical protein
MSITTYRNTVPKLSPAPDPLLGDYAAALDGGLQTLTDILLDAVGKIVTVRKYGAAGDGVHDDTAALQAAFNAAASQGFPVFIEPGVYKTTATISVPDGLVVRGTNATLLGTAAVPILTVSFTPGNAGGGVIDGLTFQGGTTGVTGIYSPAFTRFTIINCSFWTTLDYCVDGAGLLSRVVGCRFGMAGPLTNQHQHIRIRGGGDNNKWAVINCDLYNAKGNASVEFGEGVQVEIAGCDFELNRATTTVKLAGMFTSHIHDNWFEGNQGASQVTLVHDVTNSVGNYSVNSHDNWWNLSGTGNLQVFTAFGACHVEFHNETGTNFNGKPIADNMGSVTCGWFWLVGHSPSPSTN